MSKCKNDPFSSLSTIVLTITVLSLTGAAIASAESTDKTNLNNEGVKAINSGNEPLAIDKLEQALKIDPAYDLALWNLSITYNHYGEKLQSFPKEALKQFHRALYFNEDNTLALKNLNQTIQKLGLNPDSFEDRRSLATAAFDRGDFIDTVVEDKLALKVKDDAGVQTQLKTSLSKLGGTLLRAKEKNDETQTVTPPTKSWAPPAEH